MKVQATAHNADMVAMGTFAASEALCTSTDFARPVFLLAMYSACAGESRLLKLKSI